MKTLLILSLALSVFTTKNAVKIIITPDKTIYEQGEMMTFKVKSNKRFRIATNGDCSSSALPPSFVREINGKFQPELGLGAQLCCGLPCTSLLRNYEFSHLDTLATGRWKVILFTCEAGAVESPIFEVK